MKQKIKEIYDQMKNGGVIISSAAYDTFEQWLGFQGE